MSRGFHIVAYTALLSFCVFFVAVNYGLQSINDDIAGKCAPASVAHAERGVEA